MYDITGRSFKLWDYSPSLSRLLIRSPRRNENDYNLDIVFFGVKHLDVDTFMGEVSIHSDISDNETYQIFTLRSATKDNTIEAVAYKISEAFGDYFDSPLNQL